MTPISASVITWGSPCGSLHHLPFEALLFLQGCQAYCLKGPSHDEVRMTSSYYITTDSYFQRSLHSDVPEGPELFWGDSVQLSSEAPGRSLPRRFILHCATWKSHCYLMRLWKLLLTSVTRSNIWFSLQFLPMPPVPAPVSLWPHWAHPNISVEVQKGWVSYRQLNRALLQVSAHMAEDLPYLDFLSRFPSLFFPTPNLSQGLGGLEC